jgi:hypothetical protein
MHANVPTTKVSGMANKLIDKIMVATGFISLSWILIFLLVAMIEK